MASHSLRGVAPATCLVLMAFAALCQAQVPTFPCPDPNSNAAPAAGGYQNIQSLEGDGLETLLLAINASLNTWIDTAGSNLVCGPNAPLDDAAISPLQACQQVVAGTNYGIKYLATYTCDIDDNTEGEDSVVLNTVVFVPLPSNNGGSSNGDGSNFQVQSVWRDTSVPARQVTVDELPATTPASAPAGDYDDPNAVANDVANDGAALAAAPAAPTTASDLGSFNLGEGLRKMLR